MNHQDTKAPIRPIPYCLDRIARVVEVKAVDLIHPVHHAQVLTYLKLMGYRLGFLINFNVPTIRSGIKRIAL